MEEFYSNSYQTENQDSVTLNIMYFLPASISHFHIINIIDKITE